MALHALGHHLGRAEDRVERARGSSLASRHRIALARVPRRALARSLVAAGPTGGEAGRCGPPEERATLHVAPVAGRASVPEETGSLRRLRSGSGGVVGAHAGGRGADGRAVAVHREGAVRGCTWPDRRPPRGTAGLFA